MNGKNTDTTAITKVSVELIKANPRNPRTIKDEKFKKLVKSIKEFPQMLDKRPLVCFTDVDGKYVVLGGNMRLKAAKEAKLKELPIMIADDWTQEQKDEFLIKDNVGFGEWDWEALSDWDSEKLDEWGLDVPEFDSELPEELSDKLKEKYLIEIDAGDEQRQEEIYNKLIAEGLNCRLLTL